MYYEDENNLYHYSYRKGDEQNPNAPIDTKNYAEDPWDKNPGGSPKKKGGSGLSGKIVALALVALDDEDGMRTRQGDAVMNQLVCFVANQWKKYYDRPAERVVCRLTDTLFAIGCADKNCAELAEELNGIYAEMPRACVASVGLMRRVPFTQSIGCACTGEVRGKNWDALYQLCEQRLKAAQTAGGDQICSK